MLGGGLKHTNYKWLMIKCQDEQTKGRDSNRTHIQTFFLKISLSLRALSTPFSEVLREGLQKNSVKNQKKKKKKDEDNVN